MRLLNYPHSRQDPTSHRVLLFPQTISLRIHFPEVKAQPNGLTLTFCGDSRAPQRGPETVDDSLDPIRHFSKYLFLRTGLDLYNDEDVLQTLTPLRGERLFLLTHTETFNARLQTLADQAGYPAKMFR